MENVPSKPLPRNHSQHVGSYHYFLHCHRSSKRSSDRCLWRAMAVRGTLQLAKSGQTRLVEEATE